ncbi:hypothetical protein JX265_010095 [Neoarthrinium moseri]|uniref:Uncharacterized protein n=1 Tax=Neoarthrinium moseri TaxID=1658444 RepID=A0A9P9WF16_9PEZI|nr:hypothetical protein JX265_010095 [Neoarthrinium moseri]
MKWYVKVCTKAKDVWEEAYGEPPRSGDGFGVCSRKTLTKYYWLENGHCTRCREQILCWEWQQDPAHLYDPYRGMRIKQRTKRMQKLQKRFLKDVLCKDFTWDRFKDARRRFRHQYEEPKWAECIVSDDPNNRYWWTQWVSFTLPLPRLYQSLSKLFLNPVTAPSWGLWPRRWTSFDTAPMHHSKQDRATVNQGIVHIVP